MRSRTTTVALAIGVVLLAGCQRADRTTTETEPTSEPTGTSEDPDDGEPMDGHGCQ